VNLVAESQITATPINANSQFVKMDLMLEKATKHFEVQYDKNNFFIKYIWLCFNTMSMQNMGK